MNNLMKMFYWKQTLATIYTFIQKITQNIIPNFFLKNYGEKS